MGLGSPKLVAAVAVTFAAAGWACSTGMSTATGDAGLARPVDRFDGDVEEPDVGVIIPATDAGPDAPAPIDAASPPDAAPCDDWGAAPPACEPAPGDSSTCVSVPRCEDVAAVLPPRLAALAIECLAGYDSRCDAELRASCLVYAAAQGCAPAPADTSPCDVVAEMCAGGDPWDVVGQCLYLAAALTPTAAGVLATCLEAGGPCDPETLVACAITLIP